MPVTHSHVSGEPNDPTADVSSDEWNAAHAGVTTAANDPIYAQKGDIVAGTGANAADRIAIGADGYALIANSLTSTGVSWGVPAGEFRFAAMSVGSAWTSNDTLSDLADMGFALNEPFEQWIIEYNLIYDGGTTGDIKFAMDWGDDGAGQWFGFGVGTGASSDTNAIKVADESTSGATITYGCAGLGTYLGITLKVYCNSGSTGTFVKLQGAQGTSNGTTTSVAAGWMYAVKVA